MHGRKQRHKQKRTSRTDSHIHARPLRSIGHLGTDQPGDVKTEHDEGNHPPKTLE